MVLCSIDCIQNITDYLQVKEQKFHVTENNIPAADNLVPNKIITGFSTIIQELTSKSKNKNVFGEHEITKALCRQWLEYSAVCVNYADIHPNKRQVLKEINIALQRNPYITGTSITIADIALFYSLYTVMVNLTNQEKAEFLNLSRWYDNLQQDKKIRRNLDLINFSVASLYL